MLNQGKKGTKGSPLYLSHDWLCPELMPRLEGKKVPRSMEQLPARDPGQRAA